MRSKNSYFIFVNNIVNVLEVLHCRPVRKTEAYAYQNIFEEVRDGVQMEYENVDGYLFMSVVNKVWPITYIRAACISLKHMTKAT